MRVLVVAAGTMAQAGMAALVESVEGLEVAAAVGETAAVDAGRLVDPDICLVDLEGVTPTEGSLAAIVAGLACPVVAICEVEGISAALATGARGALSPGITGAALEAALVAAAAGIEVVHPPGGRADLELRAEALPERAPVFLAEPLTNRELQVLQLLPQGLTNQEVARRLGVSEHTAKFHVSAILGKLGAQSRAEAVTRGYRLGLISI